MREREKRALWEEMVYQCGGIFSDEELFKFHKRFLRSWDTCESVVMVKKEDLMEPLRKRLVAAPASEKNKSRSALTGTKRRFSHHQEHSDDSEESLPLAVWKKRANNKEQRPTESHVAHVPKAKRSLGRPSESARLPEPQNGDMSEAAKTIAKFTKSQERFRASVPVDEELERFRKANLDALVAEKRIEQNAEMKAQRLAVAQRKSKNSAVKIDEVQAAHIAPGVIDLSPPKELPKKDTRKMPGDSKKIAERIRPITQVRPPGVINLSPATEMPKKDTRKMSGDSKKIAERNGPIIHLNDSVQQKVGAPLMLTSIRFDHTYNLAPTTDDKNLQTKQQKYNDTAGVTNDIEVEELLIDDALEMTTPITEVNMDLCEILENDLVSEIEIFTNGDNAQLDMHVDNGIELWLRDIDTEMPDKLDYELNEKQDKNIPNCIDAINSLTDDMPPLVFESSGNNDTLNELGHYDEQQNEPPNFENILINQLSNNSTLLELKAESDIHNHNKEEFLLEDQLATSLKSKETTVNKTPLELEASENNDLSYDYEDDDVLSVAASCYDLEDLINDEPAVKKVCQQQDEKKEKIDLQKLKEQPKVMQSLYKASEIKPKPKPKPVAVAKNLEPLAEAAKPEPIENPQDEVNIKRAQALAARRPSVNCPVFAPPYRLPQVPNTNDNIACVSTDNYNATNLGIFGIKCWPNLDLDCQKVDCHHEAPNIPEVVRRLMRLDESELITSYEAIRESSVLFQQYITHFADIFANRRMFRCLLQTIVDCRLYKEFIAPCLLHLYTAFKQFGKEAEGLKCIMQHLWLPSKAIKFKELTEAILNILSSANWSDYATELTDLFKTHHFPMPNDFMTAIVKSALMKRELLQLALQLVLLRRVDGVHDKALIETLKMIANSDGTSQLESTTITATSETLQQQPNSSECQNGSTNDECVSKNRARILSVDYLHTAANGVSTWHPLDNYKPK
ncbi:enolase-phosphatase E1 isoform X2 [Drosophila willistoni]|uniref:enolase-phosphatase E1 isoform X2 n=1 Tax=Drosophila willistoni TaxID=7260 RepID=UPI000C26CA3E|nr:enolase-phosphatase E1 isoform X2 [Drosophila willistoni]